MGEGHEVRVTMRLRTYVHKEQADALAAALRRPPSHRLLRGGGPDVHGLAMSSPPVVRPSRAPLRRANPLTCGFAFDSTIVGRDWGQNLRHS